jgi:18S rRNA (adenine1779-N6/adenine1780-N6)-dimethyltransferase
VSLRKRFGQHLLKNADVVKNIVEAANIQPDETVFEIGPGTGNMTVHMLERAKGVYAVELDPRLAEIVTRRVHGMGLSDKFFCTNADFLKVPLPAFDKLVANIPYQISSPVLTRLFTHTPVPKAAVIMFQLEFAERIVARPGTANYSKLSVNCQMLSHSVRMVMKIGKEQFRPPPKVDSAVVEIIPKGIPAGLDFARWDTFLRVAFGGKNKLLRSVLANKHVLAQLAANRAGGAAAAGAVAPAGDRMSGAAEAAAGAAAASAVAVSRPSTQALVTRSHQSAGPSLMAGSSLMTGLGAAIRMFASWPRAAAARSGASAAVAVDMSAAENGAEAEGVGGAERGAADSVDTGSPQRGRPRSQQHVQSGMRHEAVSRASSPPRLEGPSRDSHGRHHDSVVSGARGSASRPAWDGRARDDDLHTSRDHRDSREPRGDSRSAGRGDTRSGADGGAAGGRDYTNVWARDGVSADTLEGPLRDNKARMKATSLVKALAAASAGRSGGAASTAAAGAGGFEASGWRAGDATTGSSAAGGVRLAPDDDDDDDDADADVDAALAVQGSAGDSGDEDDAVDVDAASISGAVSRDGSASPARASRVAAGAAPGSSDDMISTAHGVFRRGDLLTARVGVDAVLQAAGGMEWRANGMTIEQFRAVFDGLEAAGWRFQRSQERHFPKLLLDLPPEEAALAAALSA